MDIQLLLGGQSVSVKKPDLQKTQSDKNQANAFANFIQKNVSGLSPAKGYAIQFRWIFQDGTKSPTWSPSYRVTTPTDAPKVPTGFTGESKFASVLITWTGNYQGAEPGKSFNGFKQINVYAGTSGTYSPSTSKLAGVIYADLTNNTITLPVDGTYVRYGQPVYIHASSVNNVNEESLKDLVATITNGATRASDVDLGPGSVTINKLKGDVLVFDNIQGGTISATSFLRAGNTTGPRIELSSSTTNITSIPDPLNPTGPPLTLTNPVLPGLSVYGSNNAIKFRADLAGNVTFGGYTPADLDTISNTASSASSTASSASSTASSAASSASQALTKTQAISSDGSSIIAPIQFPDGQGSIYSLKSSYANDATAGWFIGWATINSVRKAVINIGDANQSVKWDGSQLSIKGTLTVGTMAIGPNVNGQDDGIFIDSNNYWYSGIISPFSLGNGSITWDGNNLNIAGALTYNETIDTLTFNTGAVVFNTNSGSFNSDNNNYAGDQTITITPSGILTKGRRLIYNGSTTPSSVSLTNGEGTFTHFNAGSVPVKVGDLLFTT